MTHVNIYEKYLIEYDKANITSSYPSLTKKEVVVLLNKAYIALISQKITGNNPRRATFGTDIKVTEDLRKLINTIKIQHSEIQHDEVVKNQYHVGLPENMMYYLQSSLVDAYGDVYNTDNVNHQIAQMFKQTATNIPWIETPVVYEEGDDLYILVDPDMQAPSFPFDVCITYIKMPTMFVIDSQDNIVNTKFELSDAAAEELINLAVLFATEIIESPRIQSKSSTLQLES